MEKNRGTVVAVVAALIVSVVSLGVAFAAFSRNLTIDGTATVTTSTWDVFWADASNGSKPASAASLDSGNITTSGSATSTTASLSATSFTWGATLSAPGDSVVYTFYARNTGDYNAIVSAINTPTLTCTSYQGTSGDMNSWCGTHISYGVYKDANCTTPVAVNDTLAKTSGYAQYWVKVSMLDNFAVDGSDLPTSEITVNPSTVTVTYSQN